MVSKASDSASKLKKFNGEQSGEGVGNLVYKIHQLKQQIQAERAVSIKEKLEKNGKKLESHVFQLISATSRNSVLSMEEHGLLNILSSRIENPVRTFSGYSQGYGAKDYVDVHEVVSSSTSTKLPNVDKIPPYTSWIFLDRNQRMAEDQSVVGRRRIYYDQHGSEALICSDSEEESAEAEEEKHEFSEGEDRIIWMAFQENELEEDVLNIVRQFVGGSTSEIQDRYNTLKENYQGKRDQNLRGSEEQGSDGIILLDKSLSAALDSFDNLFCRRCFVFDCHLHGCSQSLINPTEKQSYWSEHEEGGKPCSDQCYLRFRVAKDLNVSKSTTLEEKDRIPSNSNAEEAGGSYRRDVIAQDDVCISGKEILITSDSAEVASGALNKSATDMQGSMGKRKVTIHTDTMLSDSALISDDIQGLKKKHKIISASEVVTLPIEGTPIVDCISKTRNLDVDVHNNNAFQMMTLNSLNTSTEDTSQKFNCPVNVSSPKSDDMPDIIEMPNLKCSAPDNSTKGKVELVLRSLEWKPIEKELYLKGIEIFGRNSCLIARNMLSGLKSCIEISRYMNDGGPLVPHKPLFSLNAFLEGIGKADTDHNEQEMSTRPRLFRRRGRNRKFKYSWKSSGLPSIWKRIADGKNQSCKQYTPCACQSMCGKQCSCLRNETCCEKYCGCSKSCKNRFRGCHCAKSQCRSRQCPCFAAGRECDPDVCRNCWVSCGDGSLGEPPRRGEGQCGNMRLLLRQQQRILLSKSDIAGWGAFLKNPVNKNDYLGEYTGELISHREADKRGKIYDRANSSFLFDLNDQYVLDAYRKGDKLKFANHSSNPNCYAKVMLVAGDHRVGIFAKEHIDASEELFYDYRYGPDQAPIWARKPEGSKRDDSSVSQGRAKKHQSH